jgi:hypothetical protein
MLGVGVVVEVVGELVVDMVVKEEKSEITRYASFTKWLTSRKNTGSRSPVNIESPIVRADSYPGSVSRKTILQITGFYSH